MTSLRWSLLFVMLAGTCVAVESPAQLREAAREDPGGKPGAYAGPGSFSDASVHLDRGEGEAFSFIDRRMLGAVAMRIAPASAHLRHRPAASPPAGLPSMEQRRPWTRRPLFVG